MWFSSQFPKGQSRFRVARPLFSGSELATGSLGRVFPACDFDIFDEGFLCEYQWNRISLYLFHPSKRGAEDGIASYMCWWSEKRMKTVFS